MSVRYDITKEKPEVFKTKLE